VSPDSSAKFELRRPLDLMLTLAPLGAGPWLRRDGEDIWRATRTPFGAASVRLHHEGVLLEVEGWGAGADWAVANASILCGELDDDSGFHPADSLISELWRRHPGLRLPRTQAVFEALVPTVLGQLVTSEEARASYRALVVALGELAPGPTRLTLPPSPQVLASTPYWTFHGFGIERRRAETIIRAARSAKRLEETLTMDMAGAYARLEAFPGIGRWTAAKVAGVALGDPDAVPVGDYHLPHLVGYVFEGTPRSTDERMLELLEPYRGHRGRVIRLLMQAGVAVPRFGPRKPLRDIIPN
jgi:3-methyladenine DNA glycosylase/8-oxoguanine DNA glycosylase